MWLCVSQWVIIMHCTVLYSLIVRYALQVEVRYDTIHSSRLSLTTEQISQCNGLRSSQCASISNTIMNNSSDHYFLIMKKQKIMGPRTVDPRLWIKILRFWMMVEILCSKISMHAMLYVLVYVYVRVYVACICFCMCRCSCACTVLDRNHF